VFYTEFIKWSIERKVRKQKKNLLSPKKKVRKSSRNIGRRKKFKTPIELLKEPKQQKRVMAKKLER